MCVLFLHYFSELNFYKFTLNIVLYIQVLKKCDTLMCIMQRGYMALQNHISVTKLHYLNLNHRVSLQKQFFSKIGPGITSPLCVWFLRQDVLDYFVMTHGEPKCNCRGKTGLFRISEFQKEATKHTLKISECVQKIPRNESY